jgi:hypothetical protein
MEYLEGIIYPDNALPVCCLSRNLKTFLFIAFGYLLLCWLDLMILIL